jgi:hypothetical protein
MSEVRRLGGIQTLLKLLSFLFPHCTIQLSFSRKFTASDDVLWTSSPPSKTKTSPRVNYETSPSFLSQKHAYLRMHHSTSPTPGGLKNQYCCRPYCSLRQWLVLTKPPKKQTMCGVCCCFPYAPENIDIRTDGAVIFRSLKYQNLLNSSVWRGATEPGYIKTSGVFFLLLLLSTTPSVRYFS